MKVFRYGLVIMAVGLMTFGLIGTASAFHSGGVAECVGCHSMHSAPTTGSHLLIGNDTSSTCLSCHEGTPGSYHVSTPEASMPAGSPPTQKGPGGDFGWLKKTYSWVPRTGASAETETGESHGHNIVATDFNYDADSLNTTAPGGSISSANFACVYCHDPHGKYRRLSDGSINTTGGPIIGSGSYNNSVAPAAGQAVGVYRLLGGNGYKPEGASGTISFPGNPDAVTPSTYNRTENSTQTRTSYGGGIGNGHVKWGTWCATCHPDMHTATTTKLVHPTDTNLAGVINAAAIYESYRGSGLTSTDGNSYLSLVPFMKETTDYAVLAPLAQNDDTALAGPANTDDVSCLSCHRAHASGFKHALRWNNEIELIVVNGEWPGTNAASAEAQQAKFAMGRTQAEMEAAYNGFAASKFSTYQRSLCNKCHQKD